MYHRRTPGAYYATKDAKWRGALLRANMNVRSLLARPTDRQRKEICFQAGRRVGRLGLIDFVAKEQDPCATRLENVPFAWWRGEVTAVT